MEWMFKENQHVGLFGIFDFGLIGGVGQDPSMILPGESEIFEFTFKGP